MQLWAWVTGNVAEASVVASTHLLSVSIKAPFLLSRKSLTKSSSPMGTGVAASVAKSSKVARIPQTIDPRHIQIHLLIPIKYKRSIIPKNRRQKIT
jgi:hypothetical protein